MQDDHVGVATIAELAAAVRGRRKQLGLSQAEVAERAGVSRPWLSEFERGKPKAELHLALRLLNALDLEAAIRPLDSNATDSRREDGPDLNAHLASYLER